jgi:hypothetical protein
MDDSELQIRQFDSLFHGTLALPLPDAFKAFRGSMRCIDYQRFLGSKKEFIAWFCENKEGIDKLREPYLCKEFKTEPVPVKLIWFSGCLAIEAVLTVIESKFEICSSAGKNYDFFSEDYLVVPVAAPIDQLKERFYETS